MTNNRSQQLVASPGKGIETLIQSNKLTFYTHHSATFIKRLGCGLVNFLTGGSGLIITQYHQGNIQTWQVYDSLTDKTLYFEQEEALRIWIEQHYNQ